MEKLKTIYQIKNLNHIIVRYCSSQKNLKENLPTPAQMQILDFIRKNQNNKIYQRDIGQNLGLRRATLSEILKTMEKNNLISRISDNKDTRIKEIILSDTAKEKFKQVKKLLENTEKTATQNIDEKELEIFFKVAKQIENNLKERVKTC